MPSAGVDGPSQPRDGGKIAVVAALRREVWPLIKNWKAVNEQHEGRAFQFFETAGMVLVCGGIGAEHARRATEAIIALHKPRLVVSAGFAGALTPQLEVGDCLMPRWVIDAKDGSRTDTGSGEGVLVSNAEVAGAQRKASLAENYGAQAVDMEAAAVARGAAAHGIAFLAVKVISDRLDFPMPPVQRFVDGKGQVQAARFAAHAAIRPWLWKCIVQLARNSSIASRVLRNTLADESIWAETASKRGSS